ELGQSVSTGESVGSMVAQRLPATLELTLAAWLLAMAGALPMGAAAALRRSSWTDGVLRALALALVSLPGFVLGLAFLWVFGFWLAWVPVVGGGGLKELWLPALCLAAAMMGVYSRMVRERFLEVLGQDYILLARAKGLGPWMVLRRHVLKNALIPLTTLWGMSLGYLLGGAVVIEVIFSWPGVGVLAVKAIADRDYPVIQAYVLLVALCFTLINLAVDLGYLFLDPRVRRRGLLRNG
ncbi:MAG: ABC transporter permease, partial [Desulfarculaceae bacterium]